MDIHGITLAKTSPGNSNFGISFVVGRAGHCAQKKGYSQKEIAKLLNVTEPAVSQYAKEKRAQKIKLDDATKKLIKEAAEKIKGSQSAFHQIRESANISNIPRRYASSTPKSKEILAVAKYVTNEFLSYPCFCKA